MFPYSFADWSQHRRTQEELTPEADKVLPLLAQAGSRGMTRFTLGRASRLRPEVLDPLLAALVEFGLLRASVEEGLQVFRAVPGSGVAPSSS